MASIFDSKISEIQNISIFTDGSTYNNGKRNAKGELQVATGIRSRASSMYTPGQDSMFKISRSKFSNFMDCERCFYLDRVKGLQEYTNLCDLSYC